MHGICTGCKRFAIFSTIWCRTCFFAIHNIAGDGQCRQCMNTIAVEWMLFEFCGEIGSNFYCNIIYTVIIVAIFREISFNFKINSNTLLVSDRTYFGKFDCRKGIGCDRDTRYPKDAKRSTMVSCSAIWLISYKHICRAYNE